MQAPAPSFPREKTASVAPRVCSDEAALGWLTKGYRHKKPRPEVRPSGVKFRENGSRYAARRQTEPVRLITG